MNDYVKERDVEKATGLRAIHYSYPSGQGLLYLTGYFIVERFKISSKLSLDYKLTQILDVVDYIETGVVKSTKVYSLEGDELLLSSQNPLPLLPEYVVKE